MPQERLSLLLVVHNDLSIRAVAIRTAGARLRMKGVSKPLLWIQRQFSAHRLRSRRRIRLKIPVALLRRCRRSKYWDLCMCLLDSLSDLKPCLFTHFPDSAISQRFSEIQGAARHCPFVVVLPAQQQNVAARIEQRYRSRWAN